MKSFPGNHIFLIALWICSFCVIWRPQIRHIDKTRPEREQIYVDLYSIWDYFFYQCVTMTIFLKQEKVVEYQLSCIGRGVLWQIWYVDVCKVVREPNCTLQSLILPLPPLQPGAVVFLWFCESYFSGFYKLYFPNLEQLQRGGNPGPSCSPSRGCGE